MVNAWKMRISSRLPANPPYTRFDYSSIVAAEALALDSLDQLPAEQIVIEVIDT